MFSINKRILIVLIILKLLTAGLVLVVPAHIVLPGEGEEPLLEGHVQRPDGALLVLLGALQVVYGAPK